MPGIATCTVNMKKVQTANFTKDANAKKQKTWRRILNGPERQQPPATQSGEEDGHAHSTLPLVRFERPPPPQEAEANLDVASGGEAEKPLTITIVGEEG